LLVERGGAFREHISSLVADSCDAGVGQHVRKDLEDRNDQLEDARESMMGATNTEKNDYLFGNPPVESPFQIFLTYRAPYVEC